ncbi:MAG: response regulator [Methanoregulaceae archaeon]|nr:response regulator [Methanoregulaceae archaeon]
MTPEEKKVEILLIEDNPADVRLIIEGLKDSRIVNHISVVQDGEEAGDFLFRRERYTDAPTPDIILLDLNLPKKDGRKLLAEIKQDARLQQIPVVVLTSSSAESDISIAYQLHANSYLQKPLDLTEFMAMIQSFEQYWLTRVILPVKSS